MYCNIFFASVLVALAASPISAGVTCRNAGYANATAEDLKYDWKLYGSLSPADKDFTFTFEVDPNDKHHGIVTRLNGPGSKATKIEVVFVVYQGMVVYNEENRTPVVVKVLFYNRGNFPNFCFYLCSNENPDDFLMIRCYETDAAGGPAIEDSVRNLQLKNGQKLYFNH